nr:formate dehydrogenase accessory sulfurtransferase FdhD [Bacillus subtilis]
MALMKDMQQGSGTFQDTGGVHNAALCDTEKLLLMRTDIGRHNALDKLYGHCLLNGMSVRDKLIVFSGRISSEVLLKAYQNRRVDCHFQIEYRRSLRFKWLKN